MVGFSLNYLSQAVCTFAMIGFLRNNSRDSPSCSEEDWSLPGSGGRGGGILLGAWWTFWLPAPEKIIYYLFWEKPPLRPKTHGLPDFHAFPLTDYLSPGFVLPYAASSGCYWNRCVFCPERAEGNPYRPLDTARVLQDLKSLTSRRRPVLIHFLDNALSPTLLVRLARDWARCPLVWVCPD